MSPDIENLMHDIMTLSPMLGAVRSVSPQPKLGGVADVMLDILNNHPQPPFIFMRSNLYAANRSHTFIDMLQGRVRLN